MFEIIEIVEDKTDILNREAYWIKYIDPEYNIDKSMLKMSHIGMKRTPETCKKIGDALRGRKLSQEQIEEMRNRQTGHRLSEETKLKLSEIKKNDPEVQENIRRVSESNVGRKYTEEHRRNISKALTGVKLPPERVERMRITSTGKKQSTETIVKRMRNNYKPIIQLGMNGEVVREWKSATEAEIQSNGEFKKKFIYRCLSGGYGRKTYKNYRWEHKNKETS